MKKNPTLPEAYQAIRATILQAGIRGLDEQRLGEQSTYCSANWSRAWSVEAGLSANWSVSHEDASKGVVGRMVFEVSFPTTKRSPAQAAAFAALAREVAELACLLEAQWGSVDVDLRAKAPTGAEQPAPPVQTTPARPL